MRTWRDMKQGTNMMVYLRFEQFRTLKRLEIPRDLLESISSGVWKPAHAVLPPYGPGTCINCSLNVEHVVWFKIAFANRVGPPSKNS